MVVTSDFVDIEFMLPRSRAGPLVVPYISYEHYYANPETQWLEDRLSFITYLN